MSVGRLRALAIALALAGCAVAGYLTWVHYGELEPVCVGGGGGCERVQASEYAELAGVPVAVLGLAGYASILLALLAPRGAGLLVAAGIALVCFGFSLYLTYLELFVIEAICQWCVASAVIATGLAAVCVPLALRAEAPPPQ
jgi:uncharacterized membrane protein